MTTLTRRCRLCGDADRPLVVDGNYCRFCITAVRQEETRPTEEIVADVKHEGYSFASSLRKLEWPPRPRHMAMLLHRVRWQVLQVGLLYQRAGLAQDALEMYDQGRAEIELLTFGERDFDGDDGTPREES